MKSVRDIVPNGAVHNEYQGFGVVRDDGVRNIHWGIDVSVHSPGPPGKTQPDPVAWRDGAPVLAPVGGWIVKCMSHFGNPESTEKPASIYLATPAPQIPAGFVLLRFLHLDPDTIPNSIRKGNWWGTPANVHKLTLPEIAKNYPAVAEGDVIARYAGNACILRWLRSVRSKDKPMGPHLHFDIIDPRLLNDWGNYYNKPGWVTKTRNPNAYYSPWAWLRDGRLVRDPHLKWNPPRYPQIFPPADARK